MMYWIAAGVALVLFVFVAVWVMNRAVGGHDE